MRGTLIVAVAALTLPWPAEPTELAHDGHRLLAQCSGVGAERLATKGALDAGFCIGLIEGFTAGVLIADEIHARAGSEVDLPFCMSWEVPLERQLDIVRDYLDAHPERRDEHAFTLMIAAFSERFPC